MTLRVGLVGLGFGEKVLAPALRRVKGVRLAGVASAHPQKAREAASRLNVPLVARGWRDLVDDPAIDALVFALPPAVQFAAARRALLLGKSVFCEKPLAPRFSEALELVRLASRKKAAGAVDFELPEIEAWRRTQACLEAGTIGELRELHVTWNVETYAVKHDLRSWKTDSRAGGGALNNFMSHTFHYIERFAGPVRRLNCRLDRARGLKRIQGETGVRLWAETRDGVLATASVVTHAPGEAEHRLVFIGTRGKLCLANRGADYGANFGLVHESGDGRQIRPTASGTAGSGGAWILRPAPSREDGRIEPAARLIGKWAQRVLCRKHGPCGLAEGARVQQLIEKARSSHRRESWEICGGRAGGMHG